MASANRARSAESGTWRGLDLRHGEAEGSTWTAGPDRRPGRRDAAGWNVPAPRLVLFDFVFLHSALVILFAFRFEKQRGVWAGGCRGPVRIQEQNRKHYKYKETHSNEHDPRLGSRTLHLAAKS